MVKRLNRPVARVRLLPRLILQRVALGASGRAFAILKRPFGPVRRLANRVNRTVPAYNREIPLA